YGATAAGAVEPGPYATTPSLAAARAGLYLVDEVRTVPFGQANIREIADLAQEAPPARRLEPAGVGRLVHRADNRLALDRHVPGHAAPLVRNWPLGRPGDGRHPVQAARPVSIEDQHVAGSKMLPGVAGELSHVRIVVVALVH